MPRLKIAWFSPLNIDGPSPSLGAYVSEQLLPLLTDRFDIDLYYPGFASYRSLPTYHYLSAFAHHERRPYDVFFYQLEDSKPSTFTRMHLALLPGVVLFHDLLFTGFGPEPLLNSSWEETVRLFETYQKGGRLEWPEPDREYDQRGPVAYRESALAPIAVFSNPANHIEYRRIAERRLSTRGRNSKSYYLPLPLDLPLFSSGAPGNRVPIIGYCGSPRIEHRAHKLLEALSRQERPYELLWLAAAGEEVQCRELLAEFGIERCRIETGRNPARWAELVPALDVAVHTLFSVYGQPGPYLEMSMAAGVPVIAARFGETECLAPQLAFQIEAGDSEAWQMSEVLRELLTRPRRNSAAQHYAREMYDRRMVAQELAAIFESNADYLAAVRTTWSAFEGEARRALLRESAMCLPEGGREAFERLARPVFEELGWT